MTSRGFYSRQHLKDAAKAINEGKSVNAAAQEFGYFIIHVFRISFTIVIKII